MKLQRDELLIIADALLYDKLMLKKWNNLNAAFGFHALDQIQLLGYPQKEIDPWTAISFQELIMSK